MGVIPAAFHLITKMRLAKAEATPAPKEVIDARGETSILSEDQESATNSSTQVTDSTARSASQSTRSNTSKITSENFIRSRAFGSSSSKQAKLSFNLNEDHNKASVAASKLPETVTNKEEVSTSVSTDSKTVESETPDSQEPTSSSVTSSSDNTPAAV
ncbi:hypothetical protein ElyMa_000864600 [Elysia marginata]|uniref:Uncharacterized protein n=1 Tax=Elysia marginata TaxID=1093978 RepID=A0AAV4H2L3_9GAST|nr:hypothetical protein ElyMa_000864600 [Elysia marginata]